MYDWNCDQVHYIKSCLFILLNALNIWMYRIVFKVVFMYIDVINLHVLLFYDELFTRNCSWNCIKMYMWRDILKIIVELYHGNAEILWYAENPCFTPLFYIKNNICSEKEKFFFSKLPIILKVAHLYCVFLTTLLSYNVLSCSKDRQVYFAIRQIINPK